MKRKKRTSDSETTSRGSKRGRYVRDVKRVTNNPIYTLYGHIIPLSNFASGWSDQRRRDDKLVKRYGAPIFVQSPVMGKIMTTLKDVRKISDKKI